jgi:hypothetical protein
MKIMFKANQEAQTVKLKLEEPITIYVSYSHNLSFSSSDTTLGGDLKADSHIACRAHAVPLPCRAAKGLECVFPI